MENPGRSLVISGIFGSSHKEYLMFPQTCTVHTCGLCTDQVRNEYPGFSVDISLISQNRMRPLSKTTPVCLPNNGLEYSMSRWSFSFRKRVYKDSLFAGRSLLCYHHSQLADNSK